MNNNIRVTRNISYLDIKSILREFKDMNYFECDNIFNIMMRSLYTAQILQWQKKLSIHWLARICRANFILCVAYMWKRCNYFPLKFTPI